MLSDKDLFLPDHDDVFSINEEECPKYMDDVEWEDEPIGFDEATTECITIKDIRRELLENTPKELMAVADRNKLRVAEECIARIASFIRDSAVFENVDFSYIPPRRVSILFDEYPIRVRALSGSAVFKTGDLLELVRTFPDDTEISYYGGNDSERTSNFMIVFNGIYRRIT